MKCYKQSIYKFLMVASCVVFMLAGAFGINSISAKAATSSWTVDLSNGRNIVFNEKQMRKDKNYTKDYKDAVVVAIIMWMYDTQGIMDDFEAEDFKIVFSEKPYQGAEYKESDNSDVTVSALSNSAGTGKYVISKETLVNSHRFNEDEAWMNINWLEELLLGERTLYGDSVFNVEIKFSDAPIVKDEEAKGTGKVSLIQGGEFEDNGIKYRIMDAIGNLSAISLTANSKSVTIPDSVGFEGYNLNVIDVAPNFMKGNKKVKKVTIGSNVTSIGNEAFYKCKKLKKVTITSTKITTFGKKAFGKDAKKFKLKLPKSCKKTYKKLLKKAKIKC